MAASTRHFKIGFSRDDVHWRALAEEEYEAVTGLFNFVVRGMKFSYDYVEVIGGKQLPNGPLTGVKGLLNRSQVDYAPATLMMTEEGWDAMAYNYPFASDELIFVTRKPEHSPEMMALFRTLSPNVWLSLLACIILVTLVCFVAMKHRCTLEEILFHLLAIALNQDGNLVPRRAGEVLLLCTWTGAMTVFSFCFKSVLLSFLTFPPLGGVRTVPDLATAIRDGQYSAFTYDGNDFPSYLQRSPNEDLRVIGENMLKNPHGDLYDLIYQNPKYPIKAFVCRRSEVSFADGTFYASKDNMGSFNFATAVSKQFCCKDEMDMLVHRFLAAGIDQKIARFSEDRFTWDLKLYLRNKNLEGLDDGENNIRKITMTDISGALIILVTGHCLSVCVLIIERRVKHRQRRHSWT